MMRAVLLLTAVMVLAQPAMAEVSGEAKVTDSDKIMIGDVRIVLFGIDSVERGQMCMIDGKPWACWEAAVRGLEILVADGPATCTETGGTDPFGRVWAVCQVAGHDINEALVRQGLAVANREQSDAYVGAEEAAKAEPAGFWRGSFMMPALFRQQRQ